MSEARPPPSPEEEFSLLWEEYQEIHDYRLPRRGDVREGVILSVQPDAVIVDIGGKQDAMVSARELQAMDADERAALQVGRAVAVYVLRMDPLTNNVLVSLRLAREYEEWRRAQELVKSEEIVRVVVVGHNKGGLLCALGNLQGFVPISQMAELAPRSAGELPAETLAGHVGRELMVKVIEVDQRRRRLILSERAALREWRSQQRARLLESLDVGQTRTGTVSSLCDFGAFVDLGGIDGLVHLSELSWSRIAHPREVLKLGQTVEVYVLNVDRERERIGLSLRRLQPDPWELAGEQYVVGQIVRGRVTHLARFGAFVEIAPGIEGLVHISELADDAVVDPSTVVAPNEEFDLLVLSVDPGRHRMGLSLKQVRKQASRGQAWALGTEGVTDPIRPDNEEDNPLMGRDPPPADADASGEACASEQPDDAPPH